VFGQAVVLVLAGSVYPAGLVMVAIYLASAHPTRLAWLFVAGAFTTTVVSGVLILVLMRAAHLDHPHNSATLGGIRILLGVVFALLGLFLLRRRRAVPAAPVVEALVTGEQVTVEPATDSARTGMLARFQRSDHPSAAFVAGVFIYLPGPGYIAAMQVIGSAHVGLAETVGAFLVVAVLDLWLVWLPVVTYRFAPERTGRLVHEFSDWLSRNGRTATAVVLLAIGAFLVATGIDALLA
jgi:hypothetical protein